MYGFVWKYYFKELNEYNFWTVINTIMNLNDISLAQNMIRVLNIAKKKNTHHLFLPAPTREKRLRFGQQTGLELSFVPVVSMRSVV